MKWLNIITTIPQITVQQGTYAIRSHIQLRSTYSAGVVTLDIPYILQKCYFLESFLNKHTDLHRFATPAYRLQIILTYSCNDAVVKSSKLF